MATKKELAGANFEMTLRTLKLLNSEADDSVKNKVHYSPTAVKSRLKLLELNLMEEIEMLSKKI